MTRVSWTAADAAECDLLLHELVRCHFEHRAWCSEQPCSHLRAAIEDVLAWRRGRMLRSLAAYLRAKQDIDEWRRAA